VRESDASRDTDIPNQKVRQVKLFRTGLP
jgi:hypothetical protein